MVKKRSRYTDKVEFILAIIIAIFLIATLLSRRFINTPSQVIPYLILSFIVVKLYHIFKRRGTILEDYISLALIIVFWILYIILGGNFNSILIIVFIIVLLYSVGLILWVKNIFKTTSIASFIISYSILIILNILLFSGAYFENNTSFTENGIPVELSFENSLYFSTITFTTVGYGDVAPLGLNRLIASIQSIMAILMNIAFIGYILSSRRFKKERHLQPGQSR